MSRHRHTTSVPHAELYVNCLSLAALLQYTAHWTRWQHANFLERPAHAELGSTVVFSKNDQ